MNKPMLNDYRKKYSEKYFAADGKAFLNYVKDLEKYCSELEKENEDFKYNLLILKGVLIRMQCDDFEKEAIEEGADKDDQLMEVLIEKYEETLSVGIDLFLRGKRVCAGDLD